MKRTLLAFAALFLLFSTSRATADKTRAQAQAALGDNAHAQTSAGAGRTYDNASAAANVDSSGSGAPVVPYNSGTVPLSYNYAEGYSPSANVPTPAAVNATPWQGDINLATLLVILAGGLLALGSMVKFPGTQAKKIIGFTVAALGLALVMVGSKIQHQFGQTMQGGLLMALGMIFVVLGVKMAMEKEADAKDKATQQTTQAEQNASQNVAQNQSTTAAQNGATNNPLQLKGINDDPPMQMKLGDPPVAPPAPPAPPPSLPPTMEA